MLAQISLIPFAQSPEDIIFFFYVLARVAGLFLVAPLLSNQMMIRSTRIGLMIFTAAILAMTLYPDYRSTTPKYLLPELAPGAVTSMTVLAITVIKELAIGYILGFAFTIIYEGLMLAGQQVGVMIGLSVAEILDPISNTSQSLIAQLFTLTASLIIVTLDLHHVFIRIVANSFDVIPLGTLNLPYEMLQDVTTGTTQLFTYALRYAAIPFVILFLVTIGLGFMGRVMPEMNIFMVGFPLKILIGYYSLILSITYFPLLLRQAFAEHYNLAQLFIRHMGPGN